MYAYDTLEKFTKDEAYLQTIRDELPYMATTGMRFKTLTKDPEVRKAVNDIVCDFYGEEEPTLPGVLSCGWSKATRKGGKGKRKIKGTWDGFIENRPRLGHFCIYHVDLMLVDIYTVDKR